MATAGLGCNGFDSSEDQSLSDTTRPAAETPVAVTGKALVSTDSDGVVGVTSSLSAASATGTAPPRKIVMRPRGAGMRPASGAGAGAGAGASAGASLAAGPAAATSQTPFGTHGIVYNGGHVMTGAVNVYYIWYGDWSNNSATSILTDLAGNLGGSPYWGMNTRFDDRFGGHVANQVRFGGSTMVSSSTQGTSLRDFQIWSIVSSAIGSGALPSDTNGVYFVLTAPDVSQQADSGQAFCQDYCGWHTYDSQTNLKYSFVGSGDHCPQSCGLPVQGPNQNQGADEMASVIAHELAETVTDPRIDGWINPGWVENGDLCAWNFGPTFTASEDGSQANVHLGTRDFLIQQLWVNAGPGGCAMTDTVQPISIGGNHTLAVQTDGSLWSWGKNDKGQLGDGNTTDRFQPKMLSPGSGPNGPMWTSVAAGNKFSLALRSDGTLWAWGDRSLGQLGDGVVSSTPVFAAKQIGGAEWAVVRAGDQHVAAIKKDGTLWSWGYNGFGQLGNGDPNNANQAVPVQEAYGMTRWIALSTGAVHTMGLTAYGNLWTWGWNDWGTLGVGDSVSRNTPALVTMPSSIATWNMIDGGFDFSLGMGNSGSILSWGRNFYGQLDAPSWQAFSLEPTQWVAPTNWSVVSAGYLHGMAVRQDGTLWTWGSNNSGQLGTGAAFGSANGPLAQESTRASNWVTALGRQQTSVAVKTDGSVWGWGSNASGQLGTGDTVSHNTPTSLVWTASRPIVQLTAPTTTSFNAPATIPLAASTSGGRIVRVEFWSGSTKLGQDTTSPYSFTWSNVGVGVYSIVAKAFNALGESTSSDPLPVTVASLSGSTATPGASVNFTTEGTIDWLNAGLVNAASIDKKNVGTHAISNFGIYAEGDIGFAQDPGSAVAVNWTDGSPHLKPHTNGTPTTNGVKISMPFQSYGYHMDVSGSASATRVLSIYAKLVNADATFTFALDGLTYTNTWSNKTATPAYRVYRINFRPSSASSIGTAFESISALRTGGNVSFLGATLH